MKRFVLVMFGLILFSGSNIFAKEVIILNVLTLDLPPMSSEKLIGGIGHGTNVDMINAAIKAGGKLGGRVIKVKHIYQPWLRAADSFKNKWEKYPIYLIGPNALKDLKFPMDEIETVYLGNFVATFCYFESHHDRSIAWEKLSDLKPYSIGTVLESVGGKILEDNGLTVSYAPTVLTAINKLYYKRTDLMIGSVNISSYMVKQLYPEIYHDFKCTEKALYTVPYGLNYWKKDKQTVKAMAILKKGYRNIINNGTYLKIFEKYWGTGNLPMSLQPKEIKKLIDELN